jgi:UDPglucose 6-dehydrogenase
MLARQLETEAPLAEATDAINAEQVHRLARIVQAHAREGDAVGILGLTYKPDTPVIEESPGIALAELLARNGVLEVNLFDPVATDAAVELLGDAVRGCATADELLERSDVVVIATPWREFASLEIGLLAEESRRLIIIDCWRLLGEDHPEGAVGIVRLGRPLETSVA